MAGSPGRGRPADLLFAMPPRWVLVTLAAVVGLSLLAGAGTAVVGPDRIRTAARGTAPVLPPVPAPTAPQPTPTAVRGLDALGAKGSVPSSAAVRTRLGAALTSKSLGKRFGAYVMDAKSGRTLLSVRSGDGVTPASTTKLLTTTAALEALGPDHRLTTRVVRTGRTVVLVGGGDPTLLGPGKHELPSYPRFAKLSALAAQTAKALGTDAGRIKVRIDDGLYSGPALAPSWKPNYVPEGDVAPVHALEIDHGRLNPRTSTRVPDPAVAAGAAFAKLLRKKGIDVTGAIERGAGGKDASTVAEVESPTVAELCEFALVYSDNDLAEALARQVALKEGRPVTFDGGAAAVRGVLAKVDVRDGVSTYDGSGLSPANRISPQALAATLRLATSGEHPELRAVLSGLPVSGFSGTLASRFGETGATGGAGLVRAKTGSLSGVSGLAGYVADRDGRVLVFAFVAIKVPKKMSIYRTHRTLDTLAARLASCGCS